MSDDEDTEIICCKKCKRDVQDNEDGIFCEGACRSWYHYLCVGITGSQYKKITKDLADIVIWMCQTCKAKLREIMIIKKQDNKLDHLTEKLHHMQQNIKAIHDNMQTYQAKHSYANVIADTKKFPTKKIPSLPQIIIKPIQDQNSSKSKKDMKKINPVDLGIKVLSRKNLADGKVILKCPSHTDTDTLTSAKQILGPDYEITKTTLKNPRIKIPGFKKDITTSETEKIIRKQNHLKDEDYFKVTYVKSFATKNTKTIFAECSPKLFTGFMNTGRLYVDWERLPVYEDIAILKCFNCQQYNHKKDNCRSRKVCSICSAEHEESNCPRSTKTCMNCVSNNNKYNTNFNVHHETNDKLCNCYKYQVERARSKINYG
ncbi:uncharacterized protein LOC126744796 [Anthonomus grandis grandis]|uniref:uncharacterized protein LOC126744796 n=1 Tax=Anthonomus grandis grandis TaxID=2921223 RepID=UPI00216648A9|nr:uncharacterized protein LOC126744796 [Anthonomus grandis grandis]